jgi:hypothetical protein
LRGIAAALADVACPRREAGNGRPPHMGKAALAMTGSPFLASPASVDGGRKARRRPPAGRWTPDRGRLLTDKQWEKVVRYSCLPAACQRRSCGPEKPNPSIGLPTISGRSGVVLRVQFASAVTRWSWPRIARAFLMPRWPPCHPVKMASSRLWEGRLCGCRATVRRL